MYCKVPTLLVGVLTTLMLPRISNAYSKGDMVSGGTVFGVHSSASAFFCDNRTNLSYECNRNYDSLIVDFI